MINIQVPDNEFKVDLRTEDYGQLLDKRQGIYMIYNEDGILMYAGKSKDVRNRVKMHMNSANSNPLKGYNHNFHYVVGFYEESYFDLSLYEIYIINTLKPKLNYDNVYTYETERYIDKWKSATTIRQEHEEELELQRKMDNSIIDFKL
ncbi:GIY-YIG nuclease family protein [Bacillus dicomae]|uniref:GIY-YIG nuclease family protein n=1 Tax=Bacillus dicomae TaxID=3088378 RepID=UPI00142F021E|nr:GIY-YIG nuclease family protein [Bacillus dicomae]